MAEECPKCGCPVPSIRFADHVKRCTALRKLPGRGTPVKPRRYVRSTTAELRAQTVAKYYQELWKKEDEDLDAMIRELCRDTSQSKTKPRASSATTAAANQGQARAKEIAAMKARIAELEAILRNRSRQK